MLLIVQKVQLAAGAGSTSDGVGGVNALEKMVREPDRQLTGSSTGCNGDEGRLLINPGPDLRSQSLDCTAEAKRIVALRTPNEGVPGDWRIVGLSQVPRQSVKEDSFEDGC